MSPAKVNETPEMCLLRFQEAVMLRAVRNALGLSARELAELVGVHLSTILKTETNRTRLKPQTMERIKELFRQRGVNFMIGLNGNVQIDVNLQAIQAIMRSYPTGDLGS